MIFQAMMTKKADGQWFHWGCALISHGLKGTEGVYGHHWQYFSVWELSSEPGTYAHASGPLEGYGEARGRLHKAVSNMKATGWTEHKDDGLSQAMVNFSEQLKQKGAVAAMQTGKLEKQTPANCVFCIIKNNGGVVAPFQYEPCSTCGVRAGKHARLHPHSLKGSECSGFTMGEDQSHKYVNPFTHMVSNGSSKALPVGQPKQPTLLEPANTGWCNFCELRKAEYPIQSFLSEQCSLCGRIASLHHGNHQHASLAQAKDACVQFSLPLHVWELYLDIKGGFPYKVRYPAGAEPAMKQHNEDACDYCIAELTEWDDDDVDETLDESPWNARCGLCGIRMGDHWTSAPHKHEMGTGCEGYVRQTANGVDPNCEACKHRQDVYVSGWWSTLCVCGQQARHHVVAHPHNAGSSLSKAQRAKCKNGFTLPSKPEMPTAQVLSDQLCLCEHWNHSHSIEVNEDTGGRPCLIKTCRCDVYKHLCQECGGITVNEWRHNSSCQTGYSERLRGEPIQGAVIEDEEPIRRHRNLEEMIPADW